MPSPWAGDWKPSAATCSDVFECPVPEGDHAALAQVAGALTVAVAAGESHSAVRAFHALIADGRSAGRRLGPVQEDRA